jgi:hypothetical protein
MEFIKQQTIIISKITELTSFYVTILFLIT